MANVIIYTRVSTDEQAEKGYSLRDQKAKLERYCSERGHTIIEHYQDDHSAKTFERPEFNKMLDFVKANKSFVDKILVQKWDRFSRNLAGALNMIAQLRSYKIEVEAIEQPLDNDVPENLIMQAIYLAAPQVENARRSLNTTNGMRKALKEGRWVSTAPIGYKNSRDASNRPILVKSEAAELIKKSFERFATGTYQIDVLRRQMNKEGLNISKNRFWVLLRDPIYSGKIKIKAYKNEPEEIVNALHDPIISEELFLEVQNVLNGKKKLTAKYSKSRDELPLRGYLVCSCCGRNLTGSASSGNGGKYIYYHCQKGCKERYLTDVAHDALLNWFSSVSIKPEIAQLYLAVMDDVFKSNEGDRDTQVKLLESEFNSKMQMKDKATEKLVNDDLDRYAYKRLTDKLTKECNEIRLQIDDLKRAESGFDEYCRYGISLLSDLTYYYSNATLEGKQKMLGSIFPEKLVFENGKYRTTQPNEILTLLCNNNNGFGENKKGQEANFSDLSLMVTPAGFKPTTFRTGI
jgi:site-specific DNA recombinase